MALEGIGVLRLRDCFALRSSHFAQDDNERRNDELTNWLNLRILNKNPAWSASCYWYLR